MFEASRGQSVMTFGRSPPRGGGEAFSNLVALLESGASTLELDEKNRSALASELAALRHRKPDLDFNSLFSGGNNAELEKRREATRRELEALREARWCLDDEGFSELGRMDSRTTSERQSINQELQELRSGRIRRDWENEEREKPPSERERIQHELRALRESKKGSSLNRINFGDDDSRGSLVQRSKSSADLGLEMSELRKSTSAARAFLESKEPKYRFGAGISGEKRELDEEAAKRKAEALKRQQRRKMGQQDERTWVMDSINKHFDVIAEEAEEEEKGDEDDENVEVFYPDSDEDEDSSDDEDDDDRGIEFKSTSNIRGLFSQVLRKVSTNIGENPEVLKDVAKDKLNLVGE